MSITRALLASATTSLFLLIPGGAAEALYAAHPTKEFGFGEWGVWGVDHPTFIHKMAIFASTHRRVVLLAYFNGTKDRPEYAEVGPASGFPLVQREDGAKRLGAYRWHVTDPIVFARSLTANPVEQAFLDARHAAVNPAADQG